MAAEASMAADAAEPSRTKQCGQSLPRLSPGRGWPAAGGDVWRLPQVSAGQFEFQRHALPAIGPEKQVTLPDDNNPVRTL
jgi:hypothetical protein